MNWQEPQLNVSLRNYKSSEYLYIYKDDPNISSNDNKIFWIFIELNGFYMKKIGKNLTLGNYNGDQCTLTGYNINMLNNWVQKIKSTISFP